MWECTKAYWDRLYASKACGELLFPEDLPSAVTEFSMDSWDNTERNGYGHGGQEV